MKTLRFTIPPLDEQRRIADLIGAVDDAIEAADDQIALSRVLHADALAANMRKLEGPTVALEEVFERILGGSWGSKPGDEEVDVIALGPTAYSGWRTDVEPKLGSLRSLSQKRAAHRELRPGDIILERSGGSPTQPVGRVLRMTSQIDRVVPSDFMRLLRVDATTADPDYIFWTLWSMYRSGTSLPFQKHTTSIRNLNIPAYLRSTTVVLPERSAQLEMVGLAESMLEVTINATGSAERLRVLRSNLLSALLSGKHEIPESYDELLEEAAP